MHVNYMSSIPVSKKSTLSNVINVDLLLAHLWVRLFVFLGALSANVSWKIYYIFFYFPFLIILYKFGYVHFSPVYVRLMSMYRVVFTISNSCDVIFMEGNEFFFFLSQLLATLCHKKNNWSCYSIACNVFFRPLKLCNVPVKPCICL